MNHLTLIKIYVKILTLLLVESKIIARRTNFNLKDINYINIFNTMTAKDKCNTKQFFYILIHI